MFKKTIDYDLASKVYDQVRTGDPEMVQQILNGISLSSHSLVLDVGCGTGNNTLLFTAATGAKVAGLDISFGMLGKAREKTQHLPFIQAPADCLPLMDGSLDFVFMTEVIHHLPDIPKTLKEIYRVLDSEGFICIVTQSHAQIDNRQTSRFFPGTAQVDKERYPDIDEIEQMLLTAGFAKVTPQEYNFKPVSLGDEFLKTVSKRGFSMLHKISDAEFENGLQDLKIAYQSGDSLLYSAGYYFVWAIKP